MCIKHQQCEQVKFHIIDAKGEIEIAPLLPNEIIECNWNGVCIPIMNGTWIPLISFASWK